MTSLIIHFLLGFPLGLFAENAGEWVMHRYILHGLGKSPESIWNYHWAEHHRLSKQHGMIDPGYRNWPNHWNTQGKEAAFLLLIVLIHLPLVWVLPGYIAGMYAALACYYYRHRKAHLDPEWARRHLPWHYRHHMGTHSDANWCIGWPWCDRLLGTARED